MHVFKRIYLLSSLALALLIPALVFTEYVDVLPATYNPEPEYTHPQENVGPISAPKALEQDVFDIAPLLWTVYFIGLVFFGIKFIKNLGQIVQRIRTNPKQKWERYVQVLLNDALPPHTFLSYIFLNKQKFVANEIPEEVLLHEQTHARQGHTYDILFVEFLQVVFWINPFIYAIKKSIKLNHEFLADEAVLNTNIPKVDYQNILLSYLSTESSIDHQSPLVNSINYSSIKKRFTIMKKETSKPKIWATILLTLPITAILFYSFSSKKYKEKEEIVAIEEITQEINQNQAPQNKAAKGAPEKLMLEYRAFIKKYQKTNTIYVKEYKRAMLIYDKLMTNEQRASVEKYPKTELLQINLGNIAPKKLTKEQFEGLKNEETYAIWIDTKHVPNSKLDQYSPTDFVHYTGSKVYKNARSKKFPQPNQYQLYTKKGFKSAFQESSINNYKQAAYNYSKALKTYLQGNKNDNSELIILKYQADEIYNSLSKTELSDYNVKPTAPLPSENTKTSNVSSTIIQGDSITIVKD